MTSHAPPRQRRLDPARRRAEILAAARTVFGRSTYDQVSTQEIAAEAGVTRGLITHYFGGKRGLYLEAVRQMLTLPSLILEELPKVSMEQRAAIAVDRWLDAVERNRDMWLAAVNASSLSQDPDVERILMESYEADIDIVLKAARMEDVVEGADQLRALIRAFGGLTREATKEWLVRGALTRTDVQVMVTDLMTHLLTATFPAVVRARRER
jgi:AcrR family transcriptional regulator